MSVVTKIFVVGSVGHVFCALECVMAVQGHLRSLTLVPIERAYAPSIVINSNFGRSVKLILSCTVSEIRRVVG